jgi:multicomponent Na+:H+ antiporter subunit D
LFISTAFIIPLVFHWRPSWCSLLSLFVVSLGFTGACILFWQVAGSTKGFLEYFLGHSWSGERFLHSGQPIGIVLRSDLFGCLLVLVITGIGLLVTLYSHKYIPHAIKPQKIGYYYSLLLLMLAGLVGICLTGDCFNFYVFLEVASISSYALVAISHKGQSLEAAFKYMLVGAFGSILVVFGIALLFSATGTLNMAYASQQINKILDGTSVFLLANFRHLIYASLGLFVIGFSIKSAFFPAHAWLADAHPVAPSSISALLSGLVVKATGVYLFIRFLFTVFGLHKNDYGQLLSTLFLIIAAITTIGGSIFAVAQNDLKRMLAYSTVAQMGYILIGIGLLTTAGLEGSILHMINHALIKSLLFLCAGAVIYKTGIRDIRQMSRLGYRMPLTMSCFTVGAMAIVGVPPLNGFMSKWALAKASLEAGLPIMLVILLLSSLLNAIYYFRVVGIAFFSSSHKEQQNYTPSEVPWEMAVPLVLLALALIFFGFKVGMLREIIKPAVQILWG